MSNVSVGQIVQLSDGRKAEVKFVGETSFSVGIWVGVELQDASGKNDGSVRGERYFTCDMGRGMFLKPTALKVIAQAPPAAAPAPVRRPSRPNSLQNPGQPSDPALKRRISLNAPSPTPGPRTARPSSMTRSPTKSPTKGIVSSSASSSRTNTPSNARVTSAGMKPKMTTRTSMGPPALPASRTTRQSSVSSVTSRTGSTAARPVGSRLSMTATAKPPSRTGSVRRPSVDSGATGPDTARSRKVGESTSPDKSDPEILSPKPTMAKSNAVDRLNAAVSPASAAARAGRATGLDPANREIKDLKTKIELLERKALEDRDKLASLPKLKQDRDRFEGIIKKLDQKVQPLQKEVTDLRKQLKEAEQRAIAAESTQGEHESELENALLDREMAEEHLEHVKMDLESAQERLEVLQLEYDILKEEQDEIVKGMTPEERASQGWLAKEMENERLKEALVRFRDITREREAELQGQNAALEEELKDFTLTKQNLDEATEKLAKSEDIIEDLRGQLETALGAEDLIEDLTHRNMSLSEEVNELKAVIDDLETLKELNDELEVNHVQNEREMQEELDFKDSVIAEQARRASQQEQTQEDMEYTLSRFRQLVTSLQTDLEDIRASHAVTETESEQLNSRSRAMMDLNMKLQLSASKAQVKTIDLELRRLEAQEAVQHLEIVKLFLPETYKVDQNSVLALLRFQRVAFKANLLQSFMRERVNGQPHPGHEDDVFHGCDAIDKLTWVSAMCNRFASAMGRCTTEEFSKYETALHELDPVERALNAWIDGLRRDELKEEKCAGELQRTIAVLDHLGEVHLKDDLASFADETHMQTANMQSHLESATVAFTALKAMVQRVVAIPELEEDELAQHFGKRAELAIGQTRSAKLLAGKAVRALEELKTRSLALQPESREVFEQCEAAAKDLAGLARQLGLDLHSLLTEEGRTEPFTFAEVQSMITTTTRTTSGSSESDMFSTYLANLRVLTAQMNDLAALCTDLDQVQEFDSGPAPWVARSRELSAQRSRPADAEEELRRLREEHSEARRAVAQREDTLSTALLKIETLEARMRDAHAKVGIMGELRAELESAQAEAGRLREDMEKQDRELRVLEGDRDKWKKIAGDSRAFAEGGGPGAGGANGSGRAGQERAVATAREMDSLRSEIESLQAAVRYLREDNRRARTTDQHRYGWLAEPLKKQPPLDQRRRALVAAEGKDVLAGLVQLAAKATVYDLSKAPRERGERRRLEATPQYHAAKQNEEYVTWRSWQDEVLEKSRIVLGGHRRGGAGRAPVARLQIRLPGADGKVIPGSGSEVQIVGSSEWEGLQATRVGDE